MQDQLRDMWGSVLAIAPKLVLFLVILIVGWIVAKLIAKDRGIGGPVEAASAYLMKSPPKQLPDDIARAQLEDFIEG